MCLFSPVPYPSSTGKLFSEDQRGSTCQIVQSVLTKLFSFCTENKNCLGGKLHPAPPPPLPDHGLTFPGRSPVSFPAAAPRQRCRRQDLLSLGLIFPLTQRTLRFGYGCERDPAGNGAKGGCRLPPFPVRRRSWAGLPPRAGVSRYHVTPPVPSEGGPHWGGGNGSIT